MKDIIKRIRTEPAVAIGILTSLVLVVLNLIANDHWTVDHVLVIIAPLLSALGIRVTVVPTSKLEEVTTPAGTTYQQPTPPFDQNKEK